MIPPPHLRPFQKKKTNPSTYSSNPPPPLSSKNKVSHPPFCTYRDVNLFAQHLTTQSSRENRTGFYGPDVRCEEQRLWILPLSSGRGRGGKEGCELWGKEEEVWLICEIDGRAVRRTRRELACFGLLCLPKTPNVVAQLALTSESEPSASLDPGLRQRS